MHAPSTRRVAAWLATAVAVTLICIPVATGEPSVAELRARSDALAARDATLAVRAARSQTALAGDRGRLDRARARYQAALDGLDRRLRGLYVAPEPTPIIEFLTGGDLNEAQARMDLLEALGRQDRGLVDAYRQASADLHVAEQAAQRHKERAVAARSGLERERRVADARLARAEKEARAAATTVSATPTLGLPLTTPAATASAGGVAIAGNGDSRGLPAALVEGRALPGDAPVDAESGTPIDSEPTPAGPDVTRALPGVGAVGPAAGAATPGTLPTFHAVASWYGPGFTSKHLASGEPYDPNAFSAASRTLRLGTMLRVAYGGKVVTVRVNDRGPYVRGRDLNLSQAAAAALGLPGGIGTVTVQILPGYVSGAARS